MTDSGDRLDWSRAKLHGPLLDKRTRPAVGDKTNPVLAPLVAACGGSGAVAPAVAAATHRRHVVCPRSYPAGTVTPRRATLVRVLRAGAGCTIVSANAHQ